MILHLIDERSLNSQGWEIIAFTRYDDLGQGRNEWTSFQSDDKRTLLSRWERSLCYDILTTSHRERYDEKSWRGFDIPSNYPQFYSVIIERSSGVLGSAFSLEHAQWRRSCPQRLTFGIG